MYTTVQKMRGNWKKKTRNHIHAAVFLSPLLIG